MSKKGKMRQAHKKDMKSRKFVYKPLDEDDRPAIPEGDYHPDAYELFKSIRWDNAWNEFKEFDSDGKFKFRSTWSFCKYMTGCDSKENKQAREQAKWLYAAIGPLEKKNKKRLVPYLGDWAYLRSSQFIGEVNRDSLLFGNPRIAAVRETVKRHLDVMEVSQGVGTIIMQWLGRYDAWSDQIDAYYSYKLFDPKLSDKKNNERFLDYTKKQEYMFSRTVDASRELLRCFGVGKDDIALLTQMMIAAMKAKIGESQANIMMAAATGTPIANLGMSTQSESNVIDGAHHTLQNNKQLSMMFGTFIQKAQTYKMEHPDLTIDGIPKDDLRTDPRLEVKDLSGKTNGKTNGKHKEHTQ
jgi:hypothetical protein